MKLAVWTYEGPPHVGAMRVATAMEDVRLVLHAPQGDTYADLLFTMIERRGERPPVTFTTFQARDLGSDTADLFKRSCAEAVEVHRPAALLVGASCTAELIQDDPGGLARSMGLPVPVVALDLPSYSKKEGWGASETFLSLVRAFASPLPPGEVRAPRAPGARPRCNILGPTALGFRHRDDLDETRGLLESLGIEVSVAAPLGARVADLARLPEADFNVVLYPETGLAAASWLERACGQPYTRTVPIGLGATEAFVREAAALAGVDPAPALRARASRAAWWSRSVDSTYLTGKRVFVFGDATHAMAAARIAADELGFEVVGLGAFNREFAREVRAAAAGYGLEALITDDCLDVEAAIAELQPELVLGTQMERHAAKRLGIACAVISPPAHVQDYPARRAPFVGYEGAAVLFDLITHPLVMGLEEHLLAMFRDDFEFNDRAGPSHLGHGGPARPARPEAPAAASSGSGSEEIRLAPSPAAAAPLAEAPRPAPAPVWSPDAEAELAKIPFFVRGKARRNTETFARERGLSAIELETLYDARSWFAR